MTVEEISNRFDLAVKKWDSGLAVNEYDKSLYLTAASEKFVRATARAYEYTDELRHLIGPLLISESIAYATGSVSGTVWTTPITNNKFLKIVYEELNGPTNPTLIPLDMNDKHFSLTSPFRKPDGKVAYRETLDSEIRIHFTNTFQNYSYIYCKYPDPIVLEDISALGLEIRGVSAPTTSELSDDSVDKIIDMAVNELMKDLQRLAPPQQEEQRN